MAGHIFEIFDLFMAFWTEPKLYLYSCQFYITVSICFVVLVSIPLYTNRRYCISFS